jgi:ADP-heptose:LPS heptosyltransferase
MQAKNEIKKVLILRFSSIGDIVLTTPIVRCVKEQLPQGSEVHFLTKNTFVAMLKNNPYISKIYGIEKKVSEIIPQLKKEKYDVIIDLHKNIRTAQVKNSLKIKSFTFNKLNLTKWIYVNFKWNLLPSTHIVDRYFEAVKKLGITNDFKGLDYFIPKEDEVLLDTLPSNFKSGYIAMAIGAKFSTKAMPTEKLILLINKLSLPVVLLGGKEDDAKAKKILNAYTEKVYNACGKYSLNSSASLVKQANLVIAHDTGLMHIAAALNKKIISVWGSTVPQFGMYPYMPQSPQNFIISEVNNLSCRPCSKLGFTSCPKKHFKCMLQQNESEIVLNVSKLLSQ